MNDASDSISDFVCDFVSDSISDYTDCGFGSGVGVVSRCRGSSGSGPCPAQSQPGPARQPGHGDVKKLPGHISFTGPGSIVVGLIL